MSFGKKFKRVLYDKIETAKYLIIKYFAVSCVVPPGIEPGTQGFSVLCSTN